MDVQVNTKRTLNDHQVDAQVETKWTIKDYQVDTMWMLSGHQVNTKLDTK